MLIIFSVASNPKKMREIEKIQKVYEALQNTGETPGNAENLVSTLLFEKKIEPLRYKNYTESDNRALTIGLIQLYTIKCAGILIDRGINILTPELSTKMYEILFEEVDISSPDCFLQYESVKHAINESILNLICVFVGRISSEIENLRRKYENESEFQTRKSQIVGYASYCDLLNKMMYYLNNKEDEDSFGVNFAFICPAIDISNSFYAKLNEFSIDEILVQNVISCKKWLAHEVKLKIFNKVKDQLLFIKNSKNEFMQDKSKKEKGNIGSKKSSTNKSDWKSTVESISGSFLCNDFDKLDSPFKNFKSPNKNKKNIKRKDTSLIDTKIEDLYNISVENIDTVYFNALLCLAAELNEDLKLKALSLIDIIPLELSEIYFSYLQSLCVDRESATLAWNVCRRNRYEKQIVLCLQNLNSSMRMLWNSLRMHEEAKKEHDSRVSANINRNDILTNDNKNSPYVSYDYIMNENSYNNGISNSRVAVNINQPLPFSKNKPNIKSKIASSNLYNTNNEYNANLYNKSDVSSTNYELVDKEYTLEGLDTPENEVYLLKFGLRFFAKVLTFVPESTDFFIKYCDIFVPFLWSQVPDYLSTPVLQICSFLVFDPEVLEKICKIFEYNNVFYENVSDKDFKSRINSNVKRLNSNVNKIGNVGNISTGNFNTGNISMSIGGSNLNNTFATVNTNVPYKYNSNDNPYNYNMVNTTNIPYSYNTTNIGVINTTNLPYNYNTTNTNFINSTNLPYNTNIINETNLPYNYNYTNTDIKLPYSSNTKKQSKNLNFSKKKLKNFLPSKAETIYDIFLQENVNQEYTLTLSLISIFSKLLLFDCFSLEIISFYKKIIKTGNSQIISAILNSCFDPNLINSSDFLSCIKDSICEDEKTANIFIDYCIRIKLISIGKGKRLNRTAYSLISKYNAHLQSVFSNISKSYFSSDSLADKLSAYKKYIPDINDINNISSIYKTNNIHNITDISNINYKPSAITKISSNKNSNIGIGYFGSINKPGCGSDKNIAASKSKSKVKNMYDEHTDIIFDNPPVYENNIAYQSDKIYKTNKNISENAGLYQEFLEKVIHDVILINNLINIKTTRIFEFLLLFDPNQTLIYLSSNLLDRFYSDNILETLSIKSTFYGLLFLLKGTKNNKEYCSFLMKKVFFINSIKAYNDIKLMILDFVSDFYITNFKIVLKDPSTSDNSIFNLGEDDYKNNTNNKILCSKSNNTPNSNTNTNKDNNNATTSTNIDNTNIATDTPNTTNSANTDSKETEISNTVSQMFEIPNIQTKEYFSILSKVILYNYYYTNENINQYIVTNYDIQPGNVETYCTYLKTLLICNIPLYSHIKYLADQIKQNDNIASLIAFYNLQSNKEKIKYEPFSSSLKLNILCNSFDYSNFVQQFSISSKIDKYFMLQAANQVKIRNNNLILAQFNTYIEQTLRSSNLEYIDELILSKILNILITFDNLEPTLKILSKLDIPSSLLPPALKLNIMSLTKHEKFTLPLDILKKGDLINQTLICQLMFFNKIGSNKVMCKWAHNLLNMAVKDNSVPHILISNLQFVVSELYKEQNRANKYADSKCFWNYFT
ncbi:hypothetical protein EDEG_02811 [Edhazardia aedis USNM 41457]|uniref:Uncharacterized protein n=1 Tax=Edhazardia aedis (strain USNM 41457) TaxID=1003232 RepID=J9DJK0_EDHAE|nr:hypothetical protein EDEG_02811 [Edhazardia aedis USNM 41457]|eukprot:EJW02795.1 hypothetical protein EDEG_02811 [Edhazardia aedis USNM 41457]